MRSPKDLFELGTTLLMTMMALCALIVFIQKQFTLVIGFGVMYMLIHSAATIFQVACRQIDVVAAAQPVVPTPKSGEPSIL